MRVVIALTFLFGFGNVLNLALRLGVPMYVAPLVAPAVDLSVLGLLLGTRYLALQGASPNSGAVLSSTDTRTLTEPFTRGTGRSLVRGSGDGLAIAQAAVEAHNGDLEFTPNAEGGLTVGVELQASSVSLEYSHAQSETWTSARHRPT